MKTSLPAFLFLLALSAVACGGAEPTAPGSSVDSLADDKNNDDDANNDDDTNHAPTLTAVSLSPAVPKAGESITATPSGAADSDGDTVTFTTVWKVNNVAVAGQTSLTFSGATKKGDSVVAVVTPSDGKLSGEGVASPALSVANSAPVLSSVSLSSGTYGLDDPKNPLTVGYTASDPDAADTLVPAIRWYKNTVLQPSFNDQSSIAFANLVNGDAWRAEVTMSDGAANSSTIASSVATINIAVNQVPTITSVSIAPSEVKVGASVEALVTGAADGDGDEVTLAIYWEKNSTIVAGQTELAFSGSFVKDDILQAFVTPYDGRDYGTTVPSQQVAVANTKPYVSSVTLSTAVFGRDDPHNPLRVYYTAGDVDVGDSTVVLVRWYKNAVLQPVYNDLNSVPFAALVNGDVWRAEVTASDGTENSDMVASVDATVSIAVNSPPTASIDLLPNAPRTNDSIYVSVVSASDGDGDPITYTVQWLRNGTPVAGQTNLAYSGPYAKNDAFTVFVSPYDGRDYGVAVSDSVVVLNTPPVVSDVALSDGFYLVGGATPALSVTFSYSDFDGDPAQNKIMWFKNGVEQPAYEDQLSVPFAALGHGEVWSVAVTAYDGDTEPGNTVVESMVIAFSNYDPATMSGPSLFDTNTIYNLPSNETVVGETDCPTDANYRCRDVRFTSPHPDGFSADLTTAAWVVHPKSITKPLAALIFLHGSGGSRDRDGAVSMLQGLAAYQNALIGASHQLIIIAISGPGEEGSSGPDIETARYQLFPNPKQNWDYLYAYVAMRTISYASEIQVRNDSAQYVTPSKIGMAGVSAGGNATFVANGVDDRLAAAVPLSASGYFNASARQGSWMSDLATAPSYVTLATENWIDPRAYLATQHAPVKMINGAQDEFFPLTSTKLTYDDIPVTKDIFMIPDFDHFYYYLRNDNLYDSYYNTTAVQRLGTAQGAWLAKYLLGVTSIGFGGALSAAPLNTAGGNVVATVAVPTFAALPPLVTGTYNVTLYASADNGWTFTAMPMSLVSGTTYQYSGTQTGVWASPAGVVWFAVVEDMISSATFGIPQTTLNWRSTPPQYPAGFTQAIRPPN